MSVLLYAVMFLLFRVAIDPYMWVCILYIQKIKRMHNFLASPWGIQEKNSENFSNRQMTPEK